MKRDLFLLISSWFLCPKIDELLLLGDEEIVEKLLKCRALLQGKAIAINRLEHITLYICNMEHNMDF